MANEFKHGTVGTELTQAEYEAVGGHVVDSQAVGDIIYASTTSQLIRLGIGSTNDILMVKSGIPDWEAQTQITSVGTIATGTWQATDIGVAYGGTGVSTLLTNAVLTGNGASAIQAETTLLFSSNKLIPTASAHDAAGTVLTMSAGATTAGTTNNIAGGALTFQGGQGKGSGAGGDIIFQTANAGGSGSSLNALATALTISDDLSATFAGAIDVDGTTNLDAVDIDGNVQLDGTFTVGVDDDGKDVKFFGETAGSYMLWDESADRAVIKAGTMMIGGAETVAQRDSGQSKLDIHGSDTYPRLSINSWSADEKGSYLQLATSQSDTIGTMATTADTAVLGYIRFEGVDTGNNFDLGASIHAVQNGSAGTRVPADLIFTTSTSSSPTEKMRILNTGLVGIGTNAPDHLLSLVNTPATSQLELRGGGTAGGGVFFCNYGNESGVMSTGVRVNAGAWTADTTAGGGSGKASFYVQAGSTHYWYSNESLTDGSNFSPAQVFTIINNGNATLAGTLTESSDARLKTNINTIDSALDKVTQMRGVTYDRTDFDKSGVGLVAQELEQIAPELVLDNDEYKSVAYTKLTAYLIEAIKELNNEIKELKGN